MLLNVIDQELNLALKEKNETKVSVLRMLKNGIHNLEISKKQALSDNEIIDLIGKQIKSRQDSIRLYQKGNRPELVKKETAEIEILKKYLPKQLTESELDQKIQEFITQTEAKDIKDMGKVMAKAKTELQGKADISLVARLVKEKLNS